MQNKEIKQQFMARSTCTLQSLSLVAERIVCVCVCVFVLIYVIIVTVTSAPSPNFQRNKNQAKFTDHALAGGQQRLF